MVPRLLAAAVGCLIAHQGGTAVPVLVIHGGAGMIKSELTPEKGKLVRADLETALTAGCGVLKSGGGRLDAVTQAIVVPENSPCFSAARRAVFTHAGRNELDSASVDGATLRAGAVAGLQHVKNPVLLARAVMEKSTHVLRIPE